MRDPTLYPRPSSTQLRYSHRESDTSHRCTRRVPCSPLGLGRRTPQELTERICVPNLTRTETIHSPCVVRKCGSTDRREYRRCEFNKAVLSSIRLGTRRYAVWKYSPAAREPMNSTSCAILPSFALVDTRVERESKWWPWPAKR